MNMAFRFDEQVHDGTSNAINYLVTRNLPVQDRARSQDKIYEIIEEYGPVVQGYPEWHPLVACSDNHHLDPLTFPDERSGYYGLDHTVLFRNAFITCPYGDGKKVIQSVKKLNSHPLAKISAEVVDVPLYMSNAVPVIIKCDWQRPMERDGTIPKSIAVPLCLEKIMVGWERADVAETWETMRSYYLGRPCGKRSSLFVSQETGQTLKSIYNSLIYTGMFGPIRV